MTFPCFVVGRHGCVWKKFPRAQWIGCLCFCYHCFSFNLVNYASFTRLLFHQFNIGCLLPPPKSVHQFTKQFRRPIPFVPVRLCVSGFERSTCEPVADETDVRPAETFAKYGKGSYGPNRFGPLGTKTLEKLSRGKRGFSVWKTQEKITFQTTLLYNYITMILLVFWGKEWEGDGKGRHSDFTVLLACCVPVVLPFGNLTNQRASTSTISWWFFFGSGWFSAAIVSSGAQSTFFRYTSNVTTMSTPAQVRCMFG